MGWGRVVVVVVGGEGVYQHLDSAAELGEGETAALLVVKELP